jgi:hypothetical protein
MVKNNEAEKSYDDLLLFLWDRNIKKLNNDNEDALQKILPYNYA